MSGKKRSKKDSKKNNENSSDRFHRRPVTRIDEEVVNPFGEDEECLDENKMFIECPGVTVYDPDTREIIAGVRWLDENDPSAGYEIVDQQIFAPEHRRRRLIRKEDHNRIRRCQACQDLTVRLMRREGPDFFIPNPKFPRKKQLKPVEKTW